MFNSEEHYSRKVSLKNYKVLRRYVSRAAKELHFFRLDLGESLWLHKSILFLGLLTVDPTY